MSVFQHMQFLWQYVSANTVFIVLLQLNKIQMSLLCRKTVVFMSCSAAFFV